MMEIEGMHIALFGQGDDSTGASGNPEEVLNLEGPRLLDHIPTLPGHQYKTLLWKYNLTCLVILIARFLPNTVSVELQKSLGYN